MPQSESDISKQSFIPSGILLRCIVDRVELCANHLKQLVLFKVILGNCIAMCEITLLTLWKRFLIILILNCVSCSSSFLTSFYTIYQLKYVEKSINSLLWRQHCSRCFLIWTVCSITAQINDLSWPEVSRTHGPSPKKTQGRKWTKDIKTRKRPVHTYPELISYSPITLLLL